MASSSTRRRDTGPLARLLSTRIATCALVVSSTLPACAPSSESSTPEAAVDAGVEASIAPFPSPSTVAWRRCSLVTGLEDDRAECATLDVPLDWDAPDGRMLPFFVKRVVGTGSDGARREPAAASHSQIWLLNGGPGAAGDDLDALLAETTKAHPTADVYLPDHRGTGRSGRLACPKHSNVGLDDFMGCVDEAMTRWGGEGFAHFTTSNAAHDLAHAIAATRAPSQPVHVYGVSYGTYLAQRYLQLHPGQATAVTIDGLCQTGLCRITNTGYWLDRVGKAYLAECAADPACAAVMGPDPLAIVRASIAAADAGTCAAFPADGAVLRSLYASLLPSFEYRIGVLAFARRIVRCNAADRAALSYFVSSQSGGSAPGEELSSDVLGFHIAFSELEADPMPSAAETAATLADAVFAAPESSIRKLYDAWPRYPRDAFVGAYPVTNVPMLLMNGTLDTQTPLAFAETVASHYTAPSQSFVVFPRGAHSILGQSPTSDVLSESCGFTVWNQFVRDPRAPLDLSCRARILAHPFEGSPKIAKELFGVPSLWGSDAVDALLPGSGDVPVSTPSGVRNLRMRVPPTLATLLLRVGLRAHGTPLR